MKRRCASLLVLVPALCSGADGTISHTVDISAEAPTVRISPQPGNRRFLDLPSLEYRFRIDARCDAGWQPESFSLNVADSRLSLSSGELNDRAGEPVLLRIPAQQIAPVAIGGFCVIGSAEEGSAGGAARREKDAALQMTIGGALSANASLVCRSGDERQITYAAHPLAVTLTCDPPVTDNEAGP